MIVNKTGIISSSLPDSNAKAYADAALGVVGTATAVLGDSPLMVLAGYTLGNAINNIPIGNSTLQNKLSDTIWNWSHKCR